MHGATLSPCTAHIPHKGILSSSVEESYLDWQVHVAAKSSQGYGAVLSLTSTVAYACGKLSVDTAVQRAMVTLVAAGASVNCVDESGESVVDNLLNGRLWLSVRWLAEEAGVNVLKVQT